MKKEILYRIQVNLQIINPNSFIPNRTVDTFYIPASSEDNAKKVFTSIIKLVRALKGKIET